MMDAEELKYNPLINDWLVEIDATENTRRNYIRAMSYYTDLSLRTPEELIEEAEQEVVSGTLMRKRRIKSYLLRFKEFLDENEYAPKTQNVYLSAVHSFYSTYEIDLPRKRQRNKIVTLEKNGKRLLTIEDVRKMVSHARTLRDKAIVLTMASSGLAQREVRSLTLGNFYEGLDAETDITTLHLRRQKVRMDFITFISPEATQMTRDYLSARGIHGHRSGKDTDHLFATRTGSQISEGRFVDIFADIGKRAGYERVSGTFSIVRPHALRKFFSSTLLNNGADIWFVDYLMGHRIDSTHEAYFRADPDKLKQRYMQYLPFLSLSETGVKTIESGEYHRLMAENEELRRALREMEHELGEHKGRRGAGAKSCMTVLANDPDVQ